MSILNKFKLAREKEDFQTICDNIENGIEFKGTNLWVLIFAIFIASLGLNVNSTAVIIGAMLVSPLMGPIMGLGFGMAVNDLPLLKKSIINFAFAVGVSLATSTIFFLLSPLNEAHSEILARTSPTIYDVLIALFGGLAGILATSSKQKGNVIPGVAIATALMPPLCTAGYGLATLQFDYFLGASYLFVINTVFIALATLITTRFLKFPYKHMPNEMEEKRVKRIIWTVVVITVLPSIYFGYDIVQQNKFVARANQFIEVAAVFPNDYLLQKNIDSKKHSITLTFGGETIGQAEIEVLKTKLPKFNLQDASLDIRQGFSYLRETPKDEKSNPLSLALIEKEKQILVLSHKMDSVNSQQGLGEQIFKELKAQNVTIHSFLLQKAINHTDTLRKVVWIAVIKSKRKISKDERKKLQDWLKLRVNANDLELVFE